jgi:hypothetical protein
MSMFAFAGRAAGRVRCTRATVASAAAKVKTTAAQRPGASLATTAVAAVSMFAVVGFAVAEEAKHSGMSDQLDPAQESLHAKFTRTISNTQRQQHQQQQLQETSSSFREHTALALERLHLSASPAIRTVRMSSSASCAAQDSTHN